MAGATKISEGTGARWHLALAGLLLVAGIAVFLGESLVRHAQLDDAYISYRYAQNLVEGHGLVYNPGEAVEGITNLLWALLVAVGIALGFKANATGHVLGLVSGIAALLAVWDYARVALPRSRAWVAALAPWPVLTSVSFALWATSGMETALFTAATTAALAAQARGRIGAAMGAAAVATFTRPDGVLVAGVVLAFHGIQQHRAGWIAWRGPALYLIGVAGLVAFRLAYYGSPVPNTFYAKVGGIPLAHGFDYLLDFLGQGVGLLVIPAVVAVVRDPRWRPGAAFCVATCAYALAVGGDVFPYGRFLLPVLACLAAMAVCGISEAWSLNRYAGILVAAAVPGAVAWQVFGTVPFGFAVALLAGAALAAVGLKRGRASAPGWVAAALVVVGSMALAVPGSGVAQALRESKRTQALREVRTGFGVLERMGFMRARRLEERGETVRLVAGGAIGAFGYFSNVPIIDLYGLVDPEIARSNPSAETGGKALPGHQRSNSDLILAREPDYILIPSPDSPISELIPANLEITVHPKLAADYEWDAEVWGYRRRSLGARP